MASLNECAFMGNLGKDAEVRQAGDSKVASFSLAVTEKYKDKESTEWINCVAWNKLADVAEKFFKKGTQLYVKGKVQTRSWEKDGVTQYRTEFVIFSFQFIGGKKEDGGQARPNPQDLHPSRWTHLPRSKRLFIPCR